MDEEEALREGRDTRLSDAVRAKEAMQGLMATEGWKFLRNQLEEQIENRKAHVLTALEGTNEIYEREFQKGEIVGIMLAIHLPQQMLNDADTVVELYRSQEDDDVDFDENTA